MIRFCVTFIHPEISGQLSPLLFPFANSSTRWQYSTLYAYQHNEKWLAFCVKTFSQTIKLNAKLSIDFVQHLCRRANDRRCHCDFPFVRFAFEIGAKLFVFFPKCQSIFLFFFLSFFPWFMGVDKSRPAASALKIQFAFILIRKFWVFFFRSTNFACPGVRSIYANIKKKKNCDFGPAKLLSLIYECRGDGSTIFMQCEFVHPAPRHIHMQISPHGTAWEKKTEKNCENLYEKLRLM